MDTPGITVRPIRTMAGVYKFCEIFYDNVRIPLSNVVGGLHNGWRTAMSTLAFERGTASLALLLALTQRVEQLLAACPEERPHLRARIAQLRAEGAAVRAMTYRIALDSADSTPDSSGSLARLSFAEYSQRVNETAIDLFGLDAPEVIGLHGIGHDYLDAYSETIAQHHRRTPARLAERTALACPSSPTRC
jgi:alkylation response protein AidB-like acyl-CoA dehydrogenase